MSPGAAIAVHASIAHWLLCDRDMLRDVCLLSLPCTLYAIPADQQQLRSTSLSHNICWTSVH